MKICIVGGGTAGWLTALILSSVRPEHEYILVESKKIGTIGVGEGSTGLLTGILQNINFNYGCHHIDFFNEADATFKFGIKHNNWTPNRKSYISPNDGTPTSKETPDGVFCYQALKYGTKQNLSELGFLLDNSLININKISGNFNGPLHALHFDSHKAGKYFEKITKSKSKICHLYDEVLNIKFNKDESIHSLLCEKNNYVEADFFIDATGFSRRIIGLTNSKWLSYEKYLPVNRAVVNQTNFAEGEVPSNYTEATAMNAGWAWKIPTRSRLGTGYVFCKDFQSDEKAVQELEKLTKTKIIEPKFINFQSGRYQYVWQKNVIAIGLSAAFAEPLEATSIHCTIVQAETFAFEFLKNNLQDTLNASNVSEYNNRISRLYDDMKDFLDLHYTGGRCDTDFWNYVTHDKCNTDKTKHLINMCQSRIPTWNDFNEYGGCAGWPIYSWILLGTGNISEKVIEKELDLTINNERYYDILKQKVPLWQQQMKGKYKQNFTLKEFYSNYSSDHFF